jgi:hypothetical protein
MTAREEKDRGQQTTPSRMAQTTPPVPPPDYGVHMMQSILEIQRSLGGVENAVKNLESTTKGHGDKLDQIGKDVHAAKVTFGVVGAIIVGAAALIGWVVTTYIAAHPH